MKCKDCDACYKGYFKSKPGEYVCIGVSEPFVIENIDNECTAYTSFIDLENIMELPQEEEYDECLNLVVDYYEVDSMEYGDNDFKIEEV